MRIYNNKMWLSCCLLLWSLVAMAQVSSVQFGKNRLQYKKFKYKFFQSTNFNTYVAAGGTELGKFASQVAEDELPQIEQQTEYSLQHRADLIVYNSYDEYKQSNIGLGTNWQNAGGTTKLVNNKLVVYFDGNHQHLRLQIRQGIAQVLVANLLFGDNIGEIASNQALLDLPKWLTDGYIAYVAEPWNTELDDALKGAILSGDYNSFYQFAFAKPELAGHGFWQFVAEKYKKDNVTYFLYLARMYKSLNKASLKICKKKFKEVLAEFMDYEDTKYNADIRQRRNAPKGQMVVSEDVSEKDMYRFQVNPNPRNNSYAMVEFSKGVYKAKLIENYYETTVLLNKGIRTNQGDINPNYPILAWDPKGTRLLVIYWEKGKTKMFVYDAVSQYKRNIQTIDGFEQILDANFMLDNNTLVLSAVRNGHSDIYTYKIEEQTVAQITNDVYDDLNPTFVSFPNRSGIIFSSNRPGNNAPNSDTVLPSKYPFNIYLVDILNQSATKQIAQLTNVKFGNASFPMQYNTSHFTFVSDENGVANRWAGFFTTQRNGLDTLYRIGDELLHNPTPKDLDSTLAAWQKQEPDSVSYFQVYKDSTYAFPITNYQTSLLETRVAGNNGQMSEVRAEGTDKYLYKLRVNEDALNRRNVNPKPTTYIKQLMDAKKVEEGKATIYQKKPVGDSAVNKIVFQSEFADEKPDSAATARAAELLKPVYKESLLSKTKMFAYRLHFNADYVMAGFLNGPLITRFQPYQGGFGPILNGTSANGNIHTRIGTSDLFEDVKFLGGYSLGSNFSDNEVFFSYQNYKRMIDWGLTYYRTTATNYSGFFKDETLNQFDNKIFTNLYQINATFPLNEVKSFRGSLAYRTDRGVVRPLIGTSAYSPNIIPYPDSTISTVLAHLEYVHDNTLNPTENIWEGLRYKVYLDANLPMQSTGTGKSVTYNFGVDARHYTKIYRNFIWAARAAADFSWGKEKIVYYLGGADGWLSPSFNSHNQPAQDQNYRYQALAVNMRGYNQNAANGNNAVVLNSELRLPIFSTFFNQPVNNAFLRNLQLIQFIDLGTAWNGKYNGIKRPTDIYTGSTDANPNPIVVKIDAGGLGPFAGGYGFGLRSTLLGYFVKADLAWPMRGLFRGPSIFYLALGLDF